MRRFGMLIEKYIEKIREALDYVNGGEILEKHKKFYKMQLKHCCWILLMLLKNKNQEPMTVNHGSFRKLNC